MESIVLRSDIERFLPKNDAISVFSSKYDN